MALSNIFENHISDKGLISGLSKPNVKKNQPNLENEEHFTKENKQMENKHMEVYSTSLATFK